MKLRALLYMTILLKVSLLTGMTLIEDYIEYYYDIPEFKEIVIENGDMWRTQFCLKLYQNRLKDEIAMKGPDTTVTAYTCLVKEETLYIQPKKVNSVFDWMTKIFRPTDHIEVTIGFDKEAPKVFGPAQVEVYQSDGIRLKKFPYKEPQEKEVY